MSEELKPCPFCGGPAVVAEDSPYQVECMACGCRTSIGCASRAESVSEWNARPAPAVQVPGGVAWPAMRDEGIDLGGMPIDRSASTWNTAVRACKAAYEQASRAADALSRPAPAVQVPEVSESDLADIVREAMQTEDYYNFPADFASYCVRRYVNAMRDDLLAAHAPATVATEAVAQPELWRKKDDHSFITHVRPVNPTEFDAFCRVEAVAQGVVANAPCGGVDVEKVMALVGEHGTLHRRIQAATFNSVRSLREDDANEVLAKLRALLASAPAGTVWDGWMPIETAPKDGTVFLIGFNETARMRGARTVYEARWCTAQEKFTSVNGFVLFDGATNWRPLPPAPAATKKEGE